MRVCILGDGLSALTLAKALINQNIFVDIFIKKETQNINQTRTLGISKYSSDFINKNIINIEKILWKIKRIEIFTDNLKNEKILNFKNNDKLFSIIKNYEFYRILEKNLSKNKYFKKSIINHEELSLVENYEIVINCDYHHKITKKYFSKKIIKKYNSVAYTTIINHENILNDTAVQIFTKLGPLAFLPINNNQTSVVYSVQSPINKKNDDIKKQIHRYNYKYQIKKIEEIAQVELKSLDLRSYHHKNILAFGDLLHRLHPLAGQGFNMTISDIMELTKIIKRRLELGLPFDQSVCSEFENNIKHRNLFFSNGINLGHEFFNVERKMKNSVLSKSVKFIGNNSSINKIFTKIADKGIFF